MTKEETIKALDICLAQQGCNRCPLKGDDLTCSDVLLENALHYLKENEPAPSANDTSSNDKINLYLNNNAKLKNCQVKSIKKLELIEQVLNVQIFENNEQHIVNIYMLAHIIGDAHGMINELLLDLKMELGDNDGN